MSAQAHEAPEPTPELSDEHGAPAPLAAAPDLVEVRRSAGVAAGVGGVAAVVAIAYLGRATATGAVLDWLFTAVMVGLAGYWLRGLYDSRTPLLVADAQGVRIRLGRTWRGLPWSAVHHVEHTPQTAWWRDGRLVVVPHNDEKVLAELDPAARRQARISERLYGAPLALPLGLSTRVVGAEGDLSAALAEFATRASVVVVEPDTDRVHPETSPEASDRTWRDSGNEWDGDWDGEHTAEMAALAAAEQHEEAGPPLSRLRALRPALAHRLARVQQRFARPEADDATEADATEADDATVAEDLRFEETGPADAPAPEPVRDLNTAHRVDVVALRHEADEVDPLQGRELRAPGRVTLVEESHQIDDHAGVTPIARAGAAVEPLVIDDFVAEPAEDPVIGPQLAAARTRLGLTVESLAERTRVRPHVIESIEVDDFEPCGGDFYAKGHLRTLARVLGVDADPLVATYEERYAHAPINPRRVFEADLASGGTGGLRSTRGGANWSLLVAVVMAVVLAWSVARLVMDTPAPLNEKPALNGSAGPAGNAGTTSTATPVRVVVKAAGGGARVVVRDGEGTVVFRGNLALGQTKSFKATPPVRVQSSDGATTVALDGAPPVALGEAGVSGQRSFVAP